MIDIFYKSYSKDFKWLEFSLKSLSKFVSVYNEIHIVIPEKDKYLFDSIKLPERTIVHLVNEYGNGYLYQQFCKITAHKHCSAEFILFADSDCIFDKPTDLNDMIVEGKPEILYTEYSKVGDAICWKECTDRFMNAPQEYEFMRRLPLIYHRSTLELISAMPINLEQYIMNSERFSEFNIMGAYAFRHQREQYNFINTDNWTYAPPISTQLWSHAKENGSDLERQEYLKAREVIKNALGETI